MKTKFGQWIYPLIFLLSLSIVGTGIPLLGQIASISILGFCFFKNYHYDVIIMVILISGGYGIFNVDAFIDYFKITDITLFLSLSCFFYYRSKNILYKKTVFYYLVFLIILLLFLINGDEPFLSQFKVYRYFLSFTFIAVPLLLFKSRVFSLHTFFKRLSVYSICLSFFIIIQAIIFSQPVLLFGTEAFEGVSISKMFSTLFRVFPMPFFIIALSIIYNILSKRNMLQQGLFLFTCLLTLTRTLWIALFFVLLINFDMKKWRSFGYVLVLGFSILITVQMNLFGIGDLLIKRFEDFQGQTQVKNGSFKDNFKEFGTGRGSQALPGIEKLINEDKILFGFGFIHGTEASKEFKIDDKNNNDKYSISAIEITQLSILVQLGLVGLLLVEAFFWSLYFLNRSRPGFKLLSSYLSFAFFMGLGGFGGFLFPASIIIISTLLAILVLVNKQFKQQVTSNST